MIVESQKIITQNPKVSFNRNPNTENIQDDYGHAIPLVIFQGKCKELMV